MSSWFPFLIPITAIVFTFVFLIRWMELRHARRNRHDDAELRRQLEDLEAKIAARDRAIDGLEDRIRVLERIVTDAGSRLSDEIERLRA